MYSYGGADYIGARGGDDLALGGRGHDDIYGGTGADELYGEDGQDFIAAGCVDPCDAGHDNRLSGGDSDDTLAAENGRADHVDGGPGYDVCYVDAIDSVFRCEVIK